METIQIGNTDLQASRVCLGTWAIGGWCWGGTDENTSIRTIHTALDKGITLIDTAPIYGFGKSEQIVGNALTTYGHRDKILIATKAGLEWHKDKIWNNSTAERLYQEVTDSLKRLKTDYIDIYQIHWPDPVTPLEETALAMKALLDQGKIRAVGLSNFSVEGIMEFSKYCPVHVSQPPYNLFERKIEEELLPYTEKNKITTLAYGSLCRGLLSGRMDAQTTFQGDDIRKIDPKFQSDRFPQYLNAVKSLNEFAETNYGKKILPLAIRWVLDKNPTTVALWGARNPKQLDSLKEISGWSLDIEAFHKINQIINEHVKDPIGPEFMAD